MNPTFDEAYCIYRQGTMVNPRRKGLGTGTGPHKRENGKEITQIVKAEKQMNGEDSFRRKISDNKQNTQSEMKW
jgi:hypothetical protein